MLRTNSQISKAGVSLLGIAEAAERIGFNAKGVSLTYDELGKKIKMNGICLFSYFKNQLAIIRRIMVTRSQTSI